MRILARIVGSAICLGLAAGAALSAKSATLPPSGEGRRDFLKYNCYGRHGTYGRGGMAISLVGLGELGDVSDAVTNGEDRGMPSFSKYLKSTDISNLTANLNSLGTPSEPIFTHWWEAVPSE